MHCVHTLPRQVKATMQGSGQMWGKRTRRISTTANMSYVLNSFNGGNIGDSIGEYYTG